MWLEKSIIYTFILSFAFAPIYANNTTSKTSLSPEDIEKISDRIIEKMQNKENDPEYRKKMLENYIARESDPRIRELRREQKIKEQNDPKMQEFRRQSMKEDFNAVSPVVNKILICAGTVIIVVLGTSFTAGLYIGKELSKKL